MAQLINAQSLFQTLYLFRVIANKMYYCSLEISINIPFLHKRICLVSSSLSARFWSWIKSSRSMFITPPTLEPTMEPYDCYTLNTGAYHGTIWLLHPQHWSLPWNHMIITPSTLEPTMEPYDYYTLNTGGFHGTIWLLHPQHWSLPWNHMIITPPTLEPTMEPLLQLAGLRVDDRLAILLLRVEPAHHRLTVGWSRWARLAPLFTQLPVLVYHSTRSDSAKHGVNTSSCV